LAPSLVRHGVGRRFAGVGDRDHDGVVIERHFAELVFLDRQFPAEGRPRKVDAALVEVAGDVGEINPLEEAVRRLPLRREAFQPELVVLDDDHLARLKRLDVRKADVRQGHALAGRRE
jgi:hypothetical protein